MAVSVPCARKRVLIVEDDSVIEEILSRIVHLADPEAEVDWVPSAEEALTRLTQSAWKHSQYQLVITDVRLDGNRSGIELWRACERYFPDTPLLVTSGMAAEEFLRAIGRDRLSPPFLPKPFHPSECRRIIEDLLRNPGQARAGAKDGSDAGGRPGSGRPAS